ncbi:methionine aminopeptidase [Fomitiporia mediterranea MF3/22]|uniref:methionine aminopeptidase n=1 Tax=Fomitiporia mediterranea (strain MF3/22) TaxID=694068 RepID=UPI0004407F33|nr:methionine aminopeptidase [Fomitiporia mediterranea MF3/22]EJD05903.1 methionine aminopeptidase [Fomitiporia mediterranea MF3/22]
MSSTETNDIPCQSSSCLNGNPQSRLECPTCNKLGIKGSFFCSQDCFKAGYPKKQHKIIHDIVNLKITKIEDNNPFGNFNFTGTLRPVYPLSPTRTVPDHIPRPDYADDGESKSERLAMGSPPRILSPEEIEKMRTVCRLGREVLDIAAAAIKPGITTDEIDDIVHQATIERNAYPSPLNYRRFPKSVCTSVNEVICHGIPDRRPLLDGDIINIDVSIYFDGIVMTILILDLGYHADLNGTYAVGDIDEDSKLLIRTTRECLDEAIKICKPGALFRDIGKVIEPIAKRNGCSVVRQYTAHGVNNLFHGNPTNIPHYAKNKAVGTMKPGMTFTIEPMINLGTWDGIHWPDDWTCTTADGKRSAQFEETLLITDTGVEVLTAGAKREL